MSRPDPGPEEPYEVQPGVPPQGPARAPLPRPSVSGTGVAAPEAQPAAQRSATRMLIYAAIFVCLVVVSLMLKASGGKTHVQSTPQIRPSLPGAVASPAAGGGPIVDSDAARHACTRPDVLQQGFTLAAAFQTTAGVAASWEDALAQGSQSSPLHDVDPSLPVTVCYIDGPWQPPAAVADYFRQRGVTPDRGILFVPHTGDVVPGPIAPHESLPILRPAAVAPVPSAGTS